MRNLHSITLQRVLTLLAGLLVFKVTGGVVFNYHNYLPPNFESDFLQGREGYFFGSYQWAFYAHLVSGPCSLILGLILISDRFRLRFPAWHRCLGRIQAVNVLFLVTPSGLWMACYAMTGPVAGIGFGTLAIANGMCMALGWRSAVQRRFAEHRRWMWRTFLLLCSAVVIRMIGGLATVTDFDAAWLYPLTAWMSWLAPLLVFEIGSFRNRQRKRSLHPAAVAAVGQ
jgi:hypothetical protein